MTFGLLNRAVRETRFVFRDSLSNETQPAHLTERAIGSPIDRINQAETRSTSNHFQTRAAPSRSRLMGGMGPMWSRDGDELFYRSSDSMMAIAVDDTEGFRPRPTDGALC